jgi:hypothetical protein
MTSLQDKYDYSYLHIKQVRLRNVTQLFQSHRDEWELNLGDSDTEPMTLKQLNCCSPYASAMPCSVLSIRESTSSAHQ